MNASSADRSMIYRNEPAISLDIVDHRSRDHRLRDFPWKGAAFSLQDYGWPSPAISPTVFVHRFPRKLRIITSKRLRGELRENF